MKITPSSFFARVVCLLCLSCWVASAEEKRPNVLLVVCDDLNDWVEGFGGHAQAATPHMDRLRKQGVSFVNAHSNNPICGPSRTSFLTGLYPHTTGYFGYNQQANGFRTFDKLEKAVMIMEHFRANGYGVFGTGKVFHNGHEDWSVWEEKDGSDNFGVDPTFGPFPWDGSWERGLHDHAMGVAHPSVLNYPGEPKHWGEGYGSLADIPEIEPDPEKGVPGYKGWILNSKPFRYVSDEDRDRMPDEMSVDYASKILSARHDRPFLMIVGFNRPHTPFYAPDEYFRRFPLAELEMPEYLEGDLEDCAKPLWNPNQIWNDAGFSKYRYLSTHSRPDALKRWVRAYLANVAFVDDQVGALMEALRTSDYAEDTIVILTSDHGYHLGEKEYTFKCSLWEESSRVPLIVRAPDIQTPEREVKEPVSLIDLYPTLIDLCDLPEDPNASGNGIPLDGNSLAPFLYPERLSTWAGKDFAIVSVAADDKLEVGQPGDPKKQFYAIRTERYRYIRCPNGEEELYDHRNDPNEWTNLVGSAAYAKTVKEMRKRLFGEIGRAK